MMRDAVDAVGAEQRGARQVDEAGDLLRRLHRARLELERAKGLHPGEHAAGQQQASRKKVRQNRLSATNFLARRGGGGFSRSESDPSRTASA